MADMTYEMTVGVRVKFSISEKEQEEAIAYGVKRGWLHQNDVDNGYEGVELDTVVEHVHMGRLKLGNLVKDAVDELRDDEMAGSCTDFDMYEDEDED